MMKKLFYSLNLLVLALLWIPVNAQQAMYIYRNDSVSFNAFMTDEIDSISYSVMDVDSVEYEGYVSQLIYTKDSIHIIPLANIDSISFITPDPILKPGVKMMREEYLPYILSVDSNIVIFAQNTPTGLKPLVGDILVGDMYEESLVDGFSGKVISVDNVPEGIKCTCEDMFVTDIFERLVIVGTAVSNTDGNSKGRAKARRESGVETIELAPFNVSINSLLSLDVNPGVEIKYEIDIEPGKQPVVVITFVHYYDWKASVKSSTEELIQDKEPMAKYPLNTPWISIKQVPGLKIQASLGAFLEVNGSIDLSMNFYGEMGYENSIRWDERGITTSKRTRYSTFNLEETDFSLNLEGKISFGVAAKLSACFASQRLFSASLNLYFGPQLVGNISFKKFPDLQNNTGVYEVLKDLQFSANLYAGLGLTLNFFDIVKFYTDWKEFGMNIRYNGTRTLYIPIVSYTYQLYSGYLFPEFDLPKYSFGKNGTADFRLFPSRNLIPFIPMSLGVSIYDLDHTRVALEYFNEKYKSEDEWNKENKVSISTLENNKNYICYPTLNFLGANITASPSLNFTTGYPVNITDFSVTNAIKNEDGFVYNGTTYSYKFETEVTVELTDDTNVEDWGYVYKDPNGDTTHISLAGLGNPYTDSRYVYYRNTPKSSAQLYGYVKYNNDYYYGLPNDYELFYDTLCIDLGLSVMWASMNIGATTPTDTGSYFAFAELAPKKVYNQQSYSYCTYIPSTYGTNYAPIENDENPNLSGNPAYDAATATWGSGWRTPTLAEMDELVDNCEWLFTTQNNVQGYRVTGPNGNSIFLPLTGTITGSSIPTVIGSNTPKGTASYWTAEWAPQTTYTGTGHPYAWMLGCFATPTDPTAPDNIKVRSMYKFYGAQIRAVKDY